jgi:molybdopterin adenylyltransferase
MTQVLLFAQARELAGTRLTVIPGTTVAEVLAQAEQLFGPEFAALCANCTIMVDDAIVHRSEFLTRPAGSELAILPPVSGGSDHAAPQTAPGLRVAVLTISDRAFAEEYEDLTGPAVETVVAEGLAATVFLRAIVPDERAEIVRVLTEWCDGDQVDLILTNGGTGLARRDVTPEATKEVLEVEAPGIAELMRAAGLQHTPFAALSRQCVGRRGGTIVVNLPGSVRGATESLEAVLQVLPHACATARSGQP